MAKTKDNKKPEKKPDFFEKYGEVGSAMELNLAIEGFLEENDTTSMKEFAAENGFTEKDVDRWVKKREQDPEAKFCRERQMIHLPRSLTSWVRSARRTKTLQEPSEKKAKG